MGKETGQEARRRRSGGLLERLRQRLDASAEGFLSFHDYMELCLYEPDYGYYTSGREKIGRSGDYYTAGALGGLLGECLAGYISKQLEAFDGPVRLVEWGGGTGRLADGVLNGIRTRDRQLYDRLRYTSVEASPYHRGLQAAALAEHRERVEIIGPEAWELAGKLENAVIFSNELPDAFPVHRVVYRQEGWMELGVRLHAAEGRFEEVERPVCDTEVMAYIERERLPRRLGQRFEVNLAALRWYRELASGLAPGSLIITIDYGDVRDELHASHRMEGTLICYRGHAASDTPLQHAGEQDITSHVNFSALMEAGQAAAMETVAYQTQKQFLVEQGILQLLQDHDASDPFSPAAKRNRAIRQLLLSDSMSELFKVLIQTKK
ncbi:SAM-dependent methyltransferase, MidA family [Paenibacillus sp. UNCCL117]|uniref:class I SAM-dependent methyltransferase n=1 Tax=unclassified Paenibacillus TaxID=185978 RepID=UPI00088D429B|nr:MULTISPECIES: SAM-dependent methyltransferase [unclassified Paenibacillus]SDC73427.1 SAM-dependent methyltransferase, MidA family [Paenibacillus sp. cl123]SFW25016.1 SAM-dependent methyltransferase, MidA family [Paenibacillus sp. UNCCL117]